jgi:hypothetical protein
MAGSWLEEMSDDGFDEPRRPTRKSQNSRRGSVCSVAFKLQISTNLDMVP